MSEARIDQICRQVGLPVSYQQRLASAFLESIGMRFCCEYGLDNCVEMAIDRVGFESIIDGGDWL